MGCGCGRGGNKRRQNRIAAGRSIRPAAAPPSPPAADTTTNFQQTNMTGNVEISKTTQSSRRRIEKLRRDAIQKRFGK